MCLPTIQVRALRHQQRLHKPPQGKVPAKAAIPSTLSLSNLLGESGDQQGSPGPQEGVLRPTGHLRGTVQLQHGAATPGVSWSLLVDPWGQQEVEWTLPQPRHASRRER